MFREMYEESLTNMWLLDFFYATLATCQLYYYMTRLLNTDSVTDEKHLN